jgi:hypothetical protein
LTSGVASSRAKPVMTKRKEPNRVVLVEKDAEST